MSIPQYLVDGGRPFSGIVARDWKEPMNDNNTLRTIKKNEAALDAHEAGCTNDEAVGIIRALLRELQS